MKVPNLRSQDFIKEPKEVEQTNMLDTTADESVNYNEVNVNGEWIATHPAFGPDGQQGRVG